MIKLNKKGDKHREKIVNNDKVNDKDKDKSK